MHLLSARFGCSGVHLCGHKQFVSTPSLESMLAARSQERALAPVRIKVHSYGCKLALAESWSSHTGISTHGGVEAMSTALRTRSTIQSYATQSTVTRDHLSDALLSCDDKHELFEALTRRPAGPGQVVAWGHGFCVPNETRFNVIQDWSHTQKPPNIYMRCAE